MFLYQEERVKFVSYKMNVCWSNLRKIFEEASCLQGNNHFPSASAKKKFVIIMLKMSPHFFLGPFQDSSSYFSISCNDAMQFSIS